MSDSVTVLINQRWEWSAVNGKYFQLSALTVWVEIPCGGVVICNGIS